MSIFVIYDIATLFFKVIYMVKRVQNLSSNHVGNFKSGVLLAPDK